MIKRILLVLTLLWGTLLTPAKAQQSNWDAATVKSLCNLVANGGDGVEYTMSDYQLVNNLTHGDGYGFSSLYARHAKVDYNGNVKSLTGGGVSNVVVVSHRTDHTGACHVASSFFSAANATKFRQQALDLGFQKSKTQGGQTFYKHSEVPGIEIIEQKSRSGKYTLWVFTIHIVY